MATEISPKPTETEILAEAIIDSFKITEYEVTGEHYSSAHDEVFHDEQVHNTFTETVRLPLVKAVGDDGTTLTGQEAVDTLLDMRNVDRLDNGKVSCTVDGVSYTCHYDTSELDALFNKY